MINSAENIKIASSEESCRLGALYLKRYWSKNIAKRLSQCKQNDFSGEWDTDKILLAVLGLGLEQTLQYLFNNVPDFETFQNWILEVNNGTLSDEKINDFNRLILNKNLDGRDEGLALDEESARFWDENGYLIIRNAVPAEDCRATVKLICEFLEIDINQPETWYTPHTHKQGIMVQLFQHPQLQKNRESERIKRVYEQLWQRRDLWVNTDRISFNPPETATYTFPGPHLHWDTSLNLPIQFWPQGLLYLSDTAENQGAFTLVPGFHNKIESWLNSLPEGVNPRNENLDALGSKPIAASEGDFIVWSSSLPHGSSPNTSKLPRIVQYINYEPANYRETKVWK